MTVLAVEPCAGRLKLSAGLFAIVVGDQGIVHISARERPLGGAEYDDEFQLQAERGTERADEYSFAERTDAAKVVVELALQGARERGQPSIRIDRVERGEPIEDLVDAFRRPLLLLGPLEPDMLAADETLHRLSSPDRKARP